MISANGPRLDQEGYTRTLREREPNLYRRGFPDVQSAAFPLGAVAEFERSMIRERQREGIALAKNKGFTKDGKPSLQQSR